MYRREREAGFTLVEVLVGLAVAAVVGALTVGLISGARRTAQRISERSAKADALISAANRMVVDAQVAVEAICPSPDALQLSWSVGPSPGSYVRYRLERAPDGRYQLHRHQVEGGVEKLDEIIGFDLLPATAGSGTTFTCLAPRLVAIRLEAAPGGSGADVYVAEAHLRSD